MDASNRLPRMRTAEQAMEEIRLLDPNTAIKAYHVRRLIKSEAVPVIRAGNRKFVNLDLLIEYLATHPSLDLQMRGQMNGFVVDDSDADIYRDCGYVVICPRDLRQMIADTPSGETLTLEVNSPGGNMFAGYEIYSVLKAATIPTEVEVQSLSGSAMSLAMLGADVIKASPVAQTMIHLPALLTAGNETEHARNMQALQSFKESVLNAYELRCKDKKTRSELAAMMEAETWMSVQDALASGFVDEVLYDDDGVIASQVVMSVGNGIRALASAGGLPSAAELRTRSKTQKDAALQQQAAGSVPPEENADKVALALEKARLGLLMNM